jgi:zinc transport system permease protein
MDAWYWLVNNILPFEWAGHLFMKNALLAVLLVAPVFGLLGTMVVNNRMAFFSDALGHGALTGIGIGVLLGFQKPLWAMILFSILFALAITFVKNSNKASTDTIIGVFSSTAVAGGVVILSRGGGFTKYSTYLIGDLLSITPTDILMLIFVLLGVVALWVLVFNKLLLISVNQTMAGSRGISIRVYEMIFTSVIAVIVTLSIQWVGLLIINSLLVLPAAAARNVARNTRQYHAVSVAIALVSCISGLILSYYWNTATGATIVLISAFFYFVTFIFKGKFG